MTTGQASTPPTPPSRAAFYAGLGFIASAILFLMIVVMMNILGSPLPCSSHMPIIFILGLALAAGSAFTLTDARVSGSLPIPYLQQHPIQLAIGGGSAIFFLVFLLGPVVWPCSPLRMELRVTSAQVGGPNPDHQMLLTVHFQFSNIPKNATLTLRLCSDALGKNVVWTEPLLDWEKGEITTALPPNVTEFFVSITAVADGESVNDIYPNRVSNPATNKANR